MGGESSGEVNVRLLWCCVVLLWCGGGEKKKGGARSFVACLGKTKTNAKMAIAPFLCLPDAAQITRCNAPAKPSVATPSRADASRVRDPR